ncbi:MAG: ATP-binding protein [Clostridia bacterium]|nr:ATP-binding protein [Clostridia bacterium]
MAYAILICGKICSGKSTYANELSRKERAVILSADEIMLSFFDPYLGDQHDIIAAKVEAYLKKKATQILDAGANVILDWGFWSKAGRRENRAFFEDKGYECRMHYVDISDETWRRNIDSRNAQVLAGRSDAYLVDDGLLEKLMSRFETPSEDEIDVVWRY